MELNISRAELKTAVAGLSRIIPSKVTLPILGGVRFAVAETGTLTATATDLDQQATYRFVNTSSVEVGTFVLPLPALKELTKGADREHLLFRVDGQQVQVTNHVGGHQIRFTLNALPVEDWPDTTKEVCTKPAKGFLDVYRRLLPFASTDQTRYNITNVFIDVSGKGDHPVCMVAVDGRRLSVWNSMAFDLKNSVAVPASRFLAWNGLTGEAQIGLREETPKRSKEPEARKAWFGVEVGSWTYVTRVPDVTFPNWRQVVPDYAAEPAKVQRCSFTDQDAEALRKILPTFPGHDGYNAAIVLVGSPEGRLTVSGRGRDASEDTLLQLEGGSTYEGKGGQIGINREYLMDALAAGFRTFSYVDEMSPLVSRDQKGGTHVVMPVRVEHEAAAAKPVPVVPVESGESTETVTVPAPVAGETNKEEVMPEKTEELSALDRLQAASETAKQKIREANSALVDLAGLIKDVAREDKQRRTEVESVRSGLAKLQSIKV